MFQSLFCVGVTALALAVSAAVAAEPALKSWSGSPTPSLALPDATGRTIDLANFRGRVVLVNFWATWCEPCRSEMASLERLRAAFAGRPFEVLAVNYGESREKVAAFAKSAPLRLPVLFDAEKAISGNWGVKGLPMSFVVDSRGRIRYWLFGERDWNDAEAKRAVGELIAEIDAPAPR